MSFFNVLSLTGGIVLFLYGITSMSGALVKIAGSNMEKALERLAGNKYKGFLLGVVVTAIIQSSSATTVMVVGFVNAGVMKLTQTVGIILGANLGTTVTAQILRLGDIPGDNMLLQVLKPSGLTPIFLVIGFILYLTGKRKKRREVGQVMIGFGVLFTGMMTMEAAVSPLRDVEWFRNMFIMFSNPFLGLLVGMVVTAIIQSSTASVGILQALSSTGQIPFASAAPIILGQNIGTCFTALLSSVGASKNAKRTAYIHLFFNILGAALFMALILILRPGNFLSFWDAPADRSMIANFHAVYNIACTTLALPFAELLVKLAERVVRKGSDESEEALIIDDRFLKTPAIALDQARLAVTRMAENARENVADAIMLMSDYDDKTMQRIVEAEDRLDRMEVRLGNYLVQLADRNLSKQESSSLTELLHSINNIERIGDHALNLAESAAAMASNDLSFSPAAQHELSVLFSAINDIMDITLEVFTNRAADSIIRVEPLEQVVDLLTKTLKQNHIERLKAGECNIDAGTILLEKLVNLERIADHCSNIAANVNQTYGIGKDYTDFDSHQHMRSLHRGENPEFTKRYKEFEDYYVGKLKNNGTDS